MRRTQNQLAGLTPREAVTSPARHFHSRVQKVFVCSKLSLRSNSLSSVDSLTAFGVVNLALTYRLCQASIQGVVRELVSCFSHQMKSSSSHDIVVIWGNEMTDLQ